MLHHHLTPVNVTEDAILDFRYSIALDAERFMRWVTEHEVDFVLHGHMHNNHHVAITRKIYPLQQSSLENHAHTFDIIGLGSTGVAAKYLPDGTGNYACIIDFSEEKPKFKFFTINSREAARPHPEFIIEV